MLQQETHTLRGSAAARQQLGVLHGEEVLQCREHLQGIRVRRKSWSRLRALSPRIQKRSMHKILGPNHAS